MKRSLLFLVALSALLPALALSATDGPRSYAAVAPLTPAPGGEGLQSLALPWPVLQASRSAGLADVRLFDAQGQALPMAWAGPPAAPELTRQLDVPRFAWPETPPTGARSGLQLRLGPDGAVLSVVDSPEPRLLAKGAERWLLDMSGLRLAEGERLSAIELDWPHLTTGLSTAVRVESSNDGQQWQLITQAQLLALNADGQALELKRIAWPAMTDTPRYLRLSFGMPLHLSASRLLSSRAGAAPPLQTLAVRFEAGGLLDLQGPLAPRSLALHLPERNSVRPLRLEQRNKADEAWRPVSQFVAWRLQREGRESESPPLQLPPQTAPARYWRLVDPGATIERNVGALDATLQWEAPVLVFVAQGESGLQLAVGRDRAAPVAQPLATLIPGYRSGAERGLPRASLGPLAPQAEPGWQERLADPEDRRRWLLWAVLVLAVAGLAALSWRLLRQIAPPAQK